MKNTSVRQFGLIVILLLELEIYEIQELTLNSKTPGKRDMMYHVTGNVMYYSSYL